MTQIIISSSDTNKHDTINKLLSGALERERRILQSAIEKTQFNLTALEEKYSKYSEQFFEQYKQGLAGDSNDTIDWAGEYQIYLDQKNKLDSLEDIVVEHK